MKAIVLVSGGLDSILAAKVIQEQGVEVIPLHFKLPFGCLKKPDQGSKVDLEEFVRENLGLKLRSVVLAGDYLEIIKNPRYGFGSNMNPCIDCKILMLQKCKDLMLEWDAKFVVTGEVLGQRPMSQHRQALIIIAKRSGLEGLVLRPLSAQLLEETIPEKEGWVDRQKLLRIGGRTRKPQFELAKTLEIKDYGTPAGGCLLTDPVFAERLKELIAHQELSLENIELLKVGRHFRISPTTKLVVGRNERENDLIQGLAKDGDYLCLPNEVLAGPTSLIRGEVNDDLIRISCEIACRYCDLQGVESAEMIYMSVKDKIGNTIRVVPLEEEKVIALRV